MEVKNEAQGSLNFPPIGEDEPNEVAKETTIDPSQEKIADLEKKLAEQDERFKKQNDDLMKIMASRPAQANQQVIHQQPPVEEEKMPDVLEDPEGYAVYINKKAEQNAERIVTEKTSQLTNKYEEDKKYERIKNHYKEIDPIIAGKNSKLVEFIAIQRVKQAAAQGLDVNTFIFGNEEQFATDVMNEAKEQLGVNKIDDNDRTGGLATTTTLPPASAVKDDEDKSGFMDSVKELRYRGR